MRTNEELLESAKEVSKNAYVPYSKFHVGACALYDSGNTYIGCNVENASYGLCLCAERNALSTAFAAGEKGNLLKIAIYSPEAKACVPCGACRQWICEFKNGHNVEVILENDDGSCLVTSIDELFPHGFKLDR